MLTDVIRAAFEDELRKIAEVNLAGVSHDSVVQNMAPAGPMETSGLAKATAILSRHQMQKTAAPSISSALAPGLNYVSEARKRRKEEPRTALQQGKSLGGHVVGGMATGRLMSEFSFGKTLPDAALKHRRGWNAMAAGAALGGAEFARKRLVEHYHRAKQKNAAVASPGMALRASQQMGKILPGVRKTLTPPLKTQSAGSTIGRAFRAA